MAFGGRFVVWGGDGFPTRPQDLDKLEMVLQAQEYEKAQGLPLQEFFDSTRGRFGTDIGRLLAGAVALRRPAACAAVGAVGDQQGASTS